MNLSELQPAEGSRQSTKRKGRGFSTGVGKTAGRGTKGQKAREGKKVRLGFEGGQMPLFRRMPKRGFTNINHKEYAIVDVAMLDKKFKSGDQVNPVTLHEAGLVKQVKAGVKIIGSSKMTNKLTVSAEKFSAGAIKTIEAVGGKVEVLTPVTTIEENK
jgi:large subunit ribosomal protein L15